MVELFKNGAPILPGQPDLVPLNGEPHEDLDNILWMFKHWYADCASFYLI